MTAIISISNLTKTYASGLVALKPITLDINRGEIFALLGPNGAGKTTLINIICGLVTASSGTVSVDGHDHARHYRMTRSKIGLVPQELTTDAFEKVWSTITFSRGLFGRAPNAAHPSPPKVGGEGYKILFLSTRLPGGEDRGEGGCVAVNLGLT